jgi:hypothetical protein
MISIADIRLLCSLSLQDRAAPYFAMFIVTRGEYNKRRGEKPCSLDNFVKGLS